MLLVGAAPARRQLILIRESDATARTEADTTLGRYYTLSYTLPDGISSHAVDLAILELYLDMRAKARENSTNEAPVVDVYALKRAYAGTVGTEDIDAGTHVDRPVALGSRRRVLIDITSIVHAHLDGRIANRGLVVGSLTGQRDGDIQLRTDVLGGHVVGRVRIYTGPLSR